MRLYTLKHTEGKLILFAAILASAMAFLDSSVVTIAVPAIQVRFHATLQDIQWVMNGYTLMLSALILISGVLGDRWGRKKVFIYGIVLFAFSSFLCSISQNVVQLIIFRIIQGTGAALMVPGSLSILSESFEESVQGKVIGMWSGFAGGLTALGPFVGGWLVQAIGWQSIFYINIPLGIIAFILTLFFVPESKNTDAQKIDILGAGLLFLSLLGIIYGLIEASVVGFTNVAILLSFFGGIVGFVLFLVVETHSPNPLIPFQDIASWLVAGSNIATLFLYFALSGVILFLVLNFQQIQHFPPILAGLGLLPSILLITFLSGPGGSLADKIGPRLPMIIGPLLVGFGMGWIALAGLHANYYFSFLPGLILFGLGMSLVIAPLTKSALFVKKKHVGAASGLNNAVARIAGLLAVAVLGLIVFSVFSQQLNSKISQSNFSMIQKQAILTQTQSLGAINIPNTFSSNEKEQARSIIDSSFLSGYRVAIGICALLAFVSSFVAFLTIPKILPKQA